MSSRFWRIPLIALLLGAGPDTLPGWLRDVPGLSGKLHIVILDPEDLAPIEMSGVDVPAPGVYPFLAPEKKKKGDTLFLAVLTPFSEKKNGRIGAYYFGEWPDEGKAPRSPAYAHPRGFVLVTKESAKARVSEHFTLGDFLTKDQAGVWPKYLALDRRLLDKLELVIVELARDGHPVKGLHVMSGFRTPGYNALEVGPGARSAVSRHMYGDAADVFPDDDEDGWLDDLNHDGRVDLEDARIVARAAEAVEKRYPALAGGIGIYPATDAHGPFVHVDVRGSPARWQEGTKP